MKFDSVDMGHRHKTGAAATKIIPGQYSSEQIMAMRSKEPKGYCETCKHTFNDFHSAWEHMLQTEGHPIHSVPR